MAYQHDFNQFSFDGAMHPNLLVHPHLQYTGFPDQSVHHDMVYAPYSFQDVFDPLPPGVYPEGYMDDASEPTTRPRLTPDQQAVLETQFLSNPKPSSATKKSLAQITKLSPARVANWFQNRRAKAKQQRKQEEFESSQQLQSTHPRADHDQIDDDEDDEEDKQEEDEDYNKHTPTVSASNVWQPKPAAGLLQNAGSQPVDVRELGYASLNRALAAAEAAVQQNVVRHQPTALDERFTMAPPQVPRPAVMPLHAASMNVTQSYRPHVLQPGWCNQQEVQPVQPSSPINASDMNFDFGFEPMVAQDLTDNLELTSPSNTTGSQTYGGVSPEIWEVPMATPTMRTHSQSNYRQPLQSPCFPMPSCGSSRRPSIADSLTNNLEHIALTAGTTPLSYHTSGSVSPDLSDAGIGLAARRKRPGLAPLTGEALRSRSYGTLIAASPNARLGMTPPAAQVLRHTKSTGYSLHNQYAGVRKSSLPRKSPLAASFAETDFQKFMAQKMADNESRLQQLTPITTNYGPQACLPEQGLAQFHMHQLPKQSSQIPEIPSRPHMVSPPITPFQSDFFNGMHPTSMMPSSSIQAQYASTADWTPPYSAGPLTNSSVSDAPLTSPDFAHFSPFPPVQYIPSLSPAHQYQSEETNNYPWMFSSDQSPRTVAMNNGIMARKSADDFKINLYEFPNQKEEHAQATKQLPRAPQQQHNVFVHESANYFNKDKSPK